MTSVSFWAKSTTRCIVEPVMRSGGISVLQCGQQARGTGTTRSSLPSSGIIRAKPLRPGCPPRFRPVGVEGGRGGADGPSELGGLELLLLSLPRRSWSDSSSFSRRSMVSRIRTISARRLAFSAKSAKCRGSFSRGSGSIPKNLTQLRHKYNATIHVVRIFWSRG